MNVTRIVLHTKEMRVTVTDVGTGATCLQRYSPHDMNFGVSKHFISYYLEVWKHFAIFAVGNKNSYFFYGT